MKVSDFDYTFPAELIASYPLANPTAVRMMTLNRAQRNWEHKHLFNFIDYFDDGDLLIFNDSKVIPCRLFAQKETGGKVEVFLIREISPSVWECLLTDSKKILEGTRFRFGDQLEGEILGFVGKRGIQTRQIRLIYEGDLMEVLEEVGHVPLPRYIKRDDEPLDRVCYQTVFAHKPGSVAAPTAGLHFTPVLLNQLKEKGVHIRFITLHVGVGTFLPIRSETVEGHLMHEEFYEIPEETTVAIAHAKKEGKCVTAIGTTTVRALESAWVPGEGIKSGSFSTEKFIHPPYQFQVVDRLLTNFHQPQSTLLILVCTFAGRELILKAYKEAILQKYRLFSYGDSMLIF